ncbi:hypothetical protein AHiyo1_28340 [Arthrobacter sp. Hiyo1]|nr:hypothetical protein AHiyo1_28340 [Arthrobacter sp. Hiyo1]
MGQFEQLLLPAYWARPVRIKATSSSAGQIRSNAGPKCSQRAINRPKSGQIRMKMASFKTMALFHVKQSDRRTRASKDYDRQPDTDPDDARCLHLNLADLSTKLSTEISTAALRLFNSGFLWRRTCTHPAGGANLHFRTRSQLHTTLPSCVIVSP